MLEAAVKVVGTGYFLAAKDDGLGRADGRERGWLIGRVNFPLIRSLVARDREPQLSVGIAARIAASMPCTLTRSPDGKVSRTVPSRSSRWRGLIRITPKNSPRRSKRSTSDSGVSRRVPGRGASIAA